MPQSDEHEKNPALSRPARAIVAFLAVIAAFVVQTSLEGHSIWLRILAGVVTVLAVQACAFGIARFARNGSK